MLSFIAPIVPRGLSNGRLGVEAISPLLVWKVLAAALRVIAPLDDLSAVHGATALGAAHLHAAIFSLRLGLGP
jgi:hypothetical protein